MNFTLCDICDTTDKKTKVFSGYFYPQQVQVDSALQFDICIDCMRRLFGKEFLKEVKRKEYLQKEIISEKELFED